MQISTISTVSTWLFAMSNLCNMCNCEWQWMAVAPWSGRTALRHGLLAAAGILIFSPAGRVREVCLAFWVRQVDPAAGHSFYPRLIQQMEESCFKTIPFTSLYIPLHPFTSLYTSLCYCTLDLFREHWKNVLCVSCFLLLLEHAKTWTWAIPYRIGAGFDKHFDACILVGSTLYTLRRMI